MHFRECLDSIWHLVPEPARRGLAGWQDIFKKAATSSEKYKVDEIEDALRDEIASRQHNRHLSGRSFTNMMPAEMA